jgi:2-oxoglutarate dehydrogenase E1 component
MSEQLHQNTARQNTASNIDLLNTAFLDGANASYMEAMYAEYIKNPNAVASDLADFFKSLGDVANDVTKNAQGASWKETYVSNRQDDNLSSLDYGHIADIVQKATDKVKSTGTATADDIRKAALGSIRAIMLVRAYRVRGHLIANLDPLKLTTQLPHPELDPQTYGLDVNDKTKIFLDGVLGLTEATVAEIIDILKRTYGGTFGIEFMHIYDPQEKSWLQQRIEGADKEIKFSSEDKKAIFKKLVQAEGFEKFLHTKYMGTKRFGLDGGESLIPGMEQMINTASSLGVEEIVFGMPHRGRLNVLSAIMEKSYTKILNEFQGGSANPEDIGGSGDVKYHLGASGDRVINGKKLHLSLVANPSHLEAVNPVVIGKVRAKQEFYNSDRTKVMPVLLHGDAAFAGQGVVAECFALSGLVGYSTGGTFHIIVNNQIGFTTAPHYSRSSPYPSDVAKTVQAPIFHVNGDDPEAVAFAFKVATEYRQRFQKDVVVDMFCYRRYGHNEGDEPSFTQPLMYDKIRSMETVLSKYKKQLIESNVISSTEAESAVNDFNNRLQKSFDEAKSYKPNKADWLDGRWGKMQRANNPDTDDRRGKTGVSQDILLSVGHKLTDIPDDFNLHKTLKRQMDAKRKMFETGKDIDWATAEALAFGTLLAEGYPVRLSGQDSGRGTFSQRHARLVDQKTESSFYPLEHIAEKQAKFQVIDSALSEFAVLGFEYGYTWEDPNSLTLWEAQFGDFANGAQVMVDQFIASAETKWLRMSGLVMLLPHGYEGQGPEHSSARLERYLQLCADDNMQVANCTTPANYFHILRRQIHRDFRKPLIMMTPKSLLRHKYAVSDVADMIDGTTFHRVLLDHAEKTDFNHKLVADSKIKRVVLCSGKIYYDLLEMRQEKKIDDVYLMRIEQIYPFPAKTLIQHLSVSLKQKLFGVKKNHAIWGHGLLLIIILNGS